MTAARRVPAAMLSAEEAVKTFDEAALGYTREQAIAEARRGAGADLSAASAACPFGVDVTALVGRTADGDFDAALAAALAAHPWPGILGRHCAKYCERAHRLGEGIEPLAIGNLERAAADFGERSRFSFRSGKPTGRRVAIVGAGSAASAPARPPRRRRTGCGSAATR